jgi:hypothetical protein
MELKNFSDDQLIEELQDRGYLRVLWHKDDILKVAQENDVTLTDDEIYFIMSDIEENHDANYGLAWDDISMKIDDVVINREK